MAWAEKLPSGRYRGVYRDGAARRRSAGTFTHKPRAARAAATAETKARRSSWSDPDAGRQTWGAWVDEWWPTRPVAPSTLKVDAGRRRVHLDPYWTSVPLRSIRRHDVRDWIAKMRRNGVQPSTVQRAVHLFSASLGAAVDAEKLELNPASKLKLEKGGQSLERFLTREEFEVLLDQMPTTHDQLIVRFLVLTGLRWGEMAGLHWNRVDFVRGVVRVVEVFDERAGQIKAFPKGRESREVPLRPELGDLLADLPRFPAPCPVPHATGKCRSSLVLTTDGGSVLRNAKWAQQVWRPAVERAGIGSLRPHDMRHSYASWLLQEGIPLAEVGRVLGHKSSETTKRYAHLASPPNAAILAALAPKVPHVLQAAEADDEVQSQARE